MRKTTELNLRRMTALAIMTAVTCVIAPLSAPIGPVPISLTTLIIALSGLLLGPPGAVASCGLYLLLGAVGLPVFAGFSGGLQVLAGPTGGYLIAYLLLAFICGFAAKRWDGKRVPYAIAMACGFLAVYAVGTLWLALSLELSFKAALFAGVIPFLPGDAAKIVIAVFAGFPLKKALEKARVLPK
ncbi:MAG: biotin transporter BioY [Clostridiales Family XIII bacterium]|jgi:biotin transport system substrate-specific component|nr:biotin transporter BioY [Clostridiales Family XIII bacterium]